MTRKMMQLYINNELTGYEETREQKRCMIIILIKSFLHQDYLSISLARLLHYQRDMPHL